MDSIQARADRAIDLLRHAGQFLHDKKAAIPETPRAMTVEEIWQALHNLQVHEIELAVQNEELHRVQAELLVSRVRYFDLYDMAPVGNCTLSDKGFILEANLTVPH